MRKRLSSVVAVAVIAVACALHAAERVDWRSVTPKTEAELKAIFDQPVEGLETPPTRDVYVYQGELTPAIAIRSRLSSLTLFADMARFGLDGPTHVAYPTAGGIRTMGRGQIAQPLSESWILVWFTGGTGWDRIRYSSYAQNNVKDNTIHTFDVPFLISFQRRPASIAVGAEGVVLRFAQEAGIVQYMPLLGVNRPAPRVTAQWAARLPDDIAQLASSWNRRLKSIPVQVLESYAIDPSRDLITLIHDFRFVPVNDDWNTPIVSDAPISPTIGLAAEFGFPVTFSGKPVDTRSPTYFGPLWVIPGASQVRVEVPGILNLITRMQVPNLRPGADADLLARIDRQLRGRAQETGMGWWAAAGAAMAQGEKAALMPYATPQTQQLIQGATMRLMHENVFGGTNTTERLVDVRRGRVYLVDYVNHHQRYAGDDEAPASEIVRGTFDYAYYTGDWNTVRQKWSDLQAAAVASYVKNNWIIQSRPNSGGDTFHDVIVGTAHMARMAAVLGKEQDFGLFSYLLARHLLAYYGFEYALLPHARKYPPWFIVLTDEEMLVWDIYEPFGGMFTPYSKSGYYGPYSGFFEHYYRMDEDIMPRYYQRFLPQHMQRIFGEMVDRNVPPPPANDNSKWSLLFLLKSRFLGWDHDRLRGWLDKADWQGKDGSQVLTALYDARNPRQMVELLNPRLNRPLSGNGVHYQSAGLRHYSLDVDIETRALSGEPAIYWFGFNAINSNVKATHNGNTILFGVVRAGQGAVSGASRSQPNWVTAVYSYNVQGR
jgi:hypothetical protein